MEIWQVFYLSIFGVLKFSISFLSFSGFLKFLCEVFTSEEMGYVPFSCEF